MLDEVTGEPGNVVFRTARSTYEVNQEQKLVRRLIGVNPPSPGFGLDLEWRPYDRIPGIEIDRRVLIYWPNSDRWELTGTVESIEGTFITPPTT